MDSTTLEQIPRESPIVELKAGVYPKQIEWRPPGTPANIVFSDEKKINSSCIHCVKPTCINYSNIEIEVKRLPEFPAYHDDNVCPVLAIQWPIGSRVPIVEKSLCFGCGICVKRCPVAAIYIEQDGTAVVQGTPNEYFIEQKGSTSQRVIDEITSKFSQAIHINNTISIDDAIMEKLQLSVEQAIGAQGPQFPNHLVRNMLCGIGMRSAIRRRGDVNVRMDLIFETDLGKNGVVEIETNTQVMVESPRDILDDIAVLISRYKYKKEDIIPIIVCLNLPNGRSEFWQVIQDIYNVLDIKIGCLTIGALICLVRARVNVNDLTRDTFFPDINNYSIRENVSNLLTQPISCSSGYLSLFESLK